MSESPYTDDATGIPPGSSLIRRISRHFVDWSVENDPRVTKQAVQFYSEELAAKFGCLGPAMSVIVEHLADDVTILASRYPGEGLARVSSDEVRGGEPECGVQMWEYEGEPANAVVFRLDGGRDLTKSKKQRIAESLTLDWIVVPDRS